VVTASLIAYAVLVAFFLTVLRAAGMADRIHRSVLNRGRAPRARRERPQYSRPRRVVDLSTTLKR
jgi:hypothetical protein